MTTQKKKATSKLLYDVVPTKDGKHIVKLNKNSKFSGVSIRLTGVEYDGEQPVVNYEIVRCPKKYDLANKDFKAFNKDLEKVLLHMITSSAQKVVEGEQNERTV
jgi:hypothetical protein